MDKLKSIVLNNFDSKGNVIQHDFEQLKNAESCTLNRFDINDEIINKLNQMCNLKTLIFSHCVFESERKLENNIENLMIIYCKNLKVESIKNRNLLKQLMFTKFENIDINDLKAFENLEELSIFECEIKNFSEIKSFKNLKILKLDGSKIDNEDILYEIQNRIDIQYKEIYHVGF